MDLLDFVNTSAGYAFWLVGLIGGVAAFSRAQRIATERYEKLTQDADQRLAQERAFWATERQAFHNEILSLRAEVNRLTEIIRKLRADCDQD